MQDNDQTTCTVIKIANDGREIARRVFKGRDKGAVMCQSLNYLLTEAERNQGTRWELAGENRPRS